MRTTKKIVDRIKGKVILGSGETTKNQVLNSIEMNHVLVRHFQHSDENKTCTPE